MILRTCQPTYAILLLSCLSRRSSLWNLRPLTRVERIGSLHLHTQVGNTWTAQVIKIIYLYFFNVQRPLVARKSLYVKRSSVRYFFLKQNCFSLPLIIDKKRFFRQFKNRVLAYLSVISLTLTIRFMVWKMKYKTIGTVVEYTSLTVTIHNFSISDKIWVIL